MGSIGRRGFAFEETMAGTYARVDAPDDHWPLSFDARVRAPSILRYLWSGRAEVSGTLDAEGLATRVPVAGTMLLRPLSRRRIGYALRFTADDGHAYEIHGQKRIRLHALLRTLTRLRADIRDPAGGLVATSVLCFDLRTQWWRFLQSWRLV